jgi:hypothetical protein
VLLDDCVFGSLRSTSALLCRDKPWNTDEWNSMSSGSEILSDSQRSTLELTSALQAFVPAEVAVAALAASGDGGYSQSHQHLGRLLVTLSHIPPFLSDALAYLSDPRAYKQEGIFRCGVFPRFLSHCVLCGAEALSG